MNVQEFTIDSIPNSFWDTIALARQDLERFDALLKQMNRRELIEFDWNYQEAKAQFKWERYIDVLLCVMSEVSEDTLDDICDWIVAQGKEYYTQIFNNPELMPTEIDNRDPALGILGAIIHEYDERYGESIPYNPKFMSASFYGKKSFRPHMLDDWFWEVVSVGSQDKKNFGVLLKQMDKGDLIEFYFNYIQAADELKAAPYLNTITSTRPMPSEAELDELCKWVVAQGHQYYTEVFYVPELMPDEMCDRSLVQRILQPVMKEYEERYGESILENE
jgi:hypothetical protein